MGRHAGALNGVMVAQGVFVGVWVPPDPCLFREPLLLRAVGVGAHTKAPGALAVACASGA